MRFDQLTGRVVSERMRFAGDPYDTVIVSIISESGDELCVKVKEDEWGLARNKDYSFFGNWTSYRNKAGFSEKQFTAFTYCKAELSSQVVDCMQLLLGRRFPRELAARVVYSWGDAAREIIERNPYILMQFPRCGFKLTDRLYLDLGKRENALKRQALCAVYDLGTNSDGSIWHPFSRVANVISTSIKGESDEVKAVRLGIRSGLLSRRRTKGHNGPLHWDGDFEWIATAMEAKWESRLAEMLIESSDLPAEWPTIPLWQDGEHQHEQLMIATSGPIGILLGSAGTGKTFTGAQAIKAVIASKREFAITAPTGKAAVRLTEALSEIDVNARAVTNHSLLGYNGSGYRHDATNPLSIDFLFVDESSMVDLEMMFRLVSACPVGCHILFLGDPYQLPPVGPGAPLRDMATFMPTGELTQVRRNAGAIVLAGSQIREGKRFKAYDYDAVEELTEATNLMIVRANSDEKRIKRMLEIYDAAINSGCDPLWDVQVLACVNKTSQLGTHALNTVLQQHLNPGSPVPGTPFRVGDKVMQTKNGWMIPYRGREFGQAIPPDAVTNAGGQVYTANGEMGRVLKIDQKSMVVEMVSPRRVVQVFKQDIEAESEEGQTGSSFSLAYAITTHKSQGSQVRFAIFMLDEYAGARRLLDRSLLYTAITRAKEATFLVGDESVAQSAVAKASIWQRKTFLRELCATKIGRKELVTA